MTTHTCDGCRKIITADQAEAQLPFLPGIGIHLGGIDGVTVAVGTEMENGPFGRTFPKLHFFPEWPDHLKGKAFCRACLLEAFKKAVAQME